MKTICYIKKVQVDMFTWCDLLEMATVNKELKTLYHTDKGKILKNDVSSIIPYSEEFHLKRKELRDEFDKIRIFTELKSILREPDYNEVDNAKDLNSVVDIAEYQVTKINALVVQAKGLK